jgi:UDP-2,3-diacylglucosamine hydrolase
MEMRTLLLSDSQLWGLEDPNQDLLCRFLRGVEADELVLVGDIFDVWWGWERAVYSAFVPFLAVVLELRRRGVRVAWVPGNHDFRLGPVLEGDYGVRTVARWSGLAGAERVVAVHGDEADVSVGQRALTAFLRGRVAARAMRWLGPGRGWEISRRLSGHSRAAGGPGLERLLGDQRLLADRLLGTEADLVCVGHSHAPGIESRPQGRLLNLGDWVDHHTFAIVEDDVRLMAWDGLHATEVSGPPRRRVAMRG